ncbi:MAG: hypothetical protein H7289_10540 [Mucilaginibacter sp.]|nr:hypothetical protein [Mucilaginibacter sp.]
MEKIFNYFKVGLIASVAILAASCKNEKLGDVVTDQNYASVNASVDNRLDVGTGSTYTLTGNDLTIPATITFSAATSTSFAINLSTNVDTVAQLVTAGTLPAASTVAFPSGSAAVVPQIIVPAGVKSVSFNIVVNRSAMEISYGKNMAAVIKMSAITKGNKIAAGKGAMILVVKTAEVLAANSIHQIAFAPPTKIFNVVADPANYTLSSVFITVNVPIALQGVPGSAFTVNAVSSPDSVTKYINNGTLPNSVAYSDVNFSIVNPVVTFAAGATTGTLSFQTKINTLLAQQPAAGMPSVKFPTVGLTISNASKYSIVGAKNTVFAVIDPNFFRPFKGTPFFIKGTVGVASDMIVGANYDFGGEGVAYHNDLNKNGDGGWRAPDFVDVSSDYTPRSVVGWNSDGFYLTWSVNVETTGNYGVVSWFGTPNTNGRWTIFVDNVSISGTNLMAATYRTPGAYGDQQPFPYQDANNAPIPVPLTAGYHILKLYMNVGQYDFRGIVFTRLP